MVKSTNISITKGIMPFVNMCHVDTRRGYSSQIKKRISKRGCKKRGLEINSNHDHKPDPAEIELIGNGQKDREAYLDDAQPVDKHPQKKYNQHHQDKYERFAKTGARYELGCQLSPADPEENTSKAAGLAENKITMALVFAVCMQAL